MATLVGRKGKNCTISASPGQYFGTKINRLVKTVSLNLYHKFTVHSFSFQVHGSLARAGKVKGQTPKVEAEEKKKKKTGSAKRRIQYNRRFVNVVETFGRKRGPNANS